MTDSYQCDITKRLFYERVMSRVTSLSDGRAIRYRLKIHEKINLIFLSVWDHRNFKNLKVWLPVISKVTRTFLKCISDDA
jgi:hypothetical protein